MEGKVNFIVAQKASPLSSYKKMNNDILFIAWENCIFPYLIWS